MNYHRLIIALVIIGSIWGSRQAVAQDWIYRAQPGDTLWDLCLEYTARRGCWIELSTYNNVPDDKKIQPGTDIRIPVSWLLELPIVGTVLNVQGEVHYQEYSGSKPVPLTAGQDLVLGSILQSAGGSASLKLGQHSELLLRPNSVLELNSMSVGQTPGQTSELQLDRGEVEVKVEPSSRSRFEIHTPSAIAAVRGTEYRVASQSGDNSTRSEVLKGLVAVQAGSSVDVPAGFGLKAKPGEALGEPRKLLSPPVFEQSRLDSPLPVIVRWSDNPGAEAWQLDLYTQAGAGELLATHHPTEPHFTFPDLAESCYRLVARGVDTEGFNGLESELPLCVQPPPPPVEETRTYWDLLLWSIIATIMLI